MKKGEQLSDTENNANFVHKKKGLQTFSLETLDFTGRGSRITIGDPFLEGFKRKSYHSLRSCRRLFMQ